MIMPTAEQRRKNSALVTQTCTLYVCIGNVEEPEIRGRIPPKYATKIENAVLDRARIVTEHDKSFTPNDQGSGGMLMAPAWRVIGRQAGLPAVS
jgi:hypothetical protein